ncbi:hypothetical protein [Peribacillus kribbensis]|uniref:hypothetical protein n=1 Tax=Peribacillus kribbensis TaxID=356658 RepID=UPI0004072D15|nr:hypothetical protein [Peribacillus kribbensis]
MREPCVDFTLITKAILSAYEQLKQEGMTNGRSMEEIMDAQKNLNQALTHHLQLYM